MRRVVMALGAVAASLLMVLVTTVPANAGVLNKYGPRLYILQHNRAVEVTVQTYYSAGSVQGGVLVTCKDGSYPVHQTMRCDKIQNMQVTLIMDGVLHSVWLNCGYGGNPQCQLPSNSRIAGPLYACGSAHTWVARWSVEVPGNEGSIVVTPVDILQNITVSNTPVTFDPC